MPVISLAQTLFLRFVRPLLFEKVYPARRPSQTAVEEWSILRVAAWEGRYPEQTLTDADFCTGSLVAFGGDTGMGAL